MLYFHIFDYLFSCKCYRIKWERIESWYGLMIEKIIRKRIINIFMLIQTWMSLDIVGWEFVVRVVTLGAPSKTVESVAACRNLLRNKLVELQEEKYLRTFVGAPDPRLLLDSISMEIDNLRIECKSTGIAKKKNTFLYTIFALPLLNGGSRKWTFSPFSRINHGDERIIKKEWKIYFQRKKAGEKSFYSVANEGLASTIPFAMVHAVVWFRVFAYNYKTIVAWFLIFLSFLAKLRWSLGMTSRFRRNCRMFPEMLLCSYVSGLMIYFSRK